MSSKPLVSIICTVYNHQKFVKEALLSVFNQTYSRIELIIVDNGSQDNSVEVIEKEIYGRLNVVFIRNQQNLGLCKAFNQGFGLSSGDYIIDLSADDVLVPSRVEKQVICFNQLSEEYAVVYTNALNITKQGSWVDYHHAVDKYGKVVVNPPSGYIYKEVLQRYFICTPTMMISRKVLIELGGYDERLTFEDFDFWVRSSAKYRYHYLDEVLTFKREVSNSLSKKVVEKGSGILDSLLLVCEKAKDLNSDAEEDTLLAERIKTFIRKCWYAGEYQLAFQFEKLLTSLGNVDYLTRFVLSACRCRIPINKLYRIYLNYFYKKKVKLKSIWC